MSKNNKRCGKAKEVPRMTNRDDHDVTDGMPHLDEHGIHDIESSQRTKNLVTRRGSLRLQSISPQEDDDDISTEESDMDLRCMEPNDPIVRV